MQFPSLNVLGSTIPHDIDVNAIAREWFDGFKEAINSNRVDDILALLLPDALWRDILALTWDFRTFAAAQNIRPFLVDRLRACGMDCLALKQFIVLQRPYPGIAWILAMFEFQTTIGLGTGVVRLVPTRSGVWKACTIFTNLDDLKDYPEKIGIHRPADMKQGRTWMAEREAETKFEASQPEVIVVGSGHSGLELAARLKSLGVRALVVERNNSIGDNWRNRYGALCLHWPVWFDHMAYIPFPQSWPKYTPSYKMADWLESYAKSLEINVWTSATVTRAHMVEGKWETTIRLKNGTEHTFSANHLVFATGTGDHSPHLPVIPQMEDFNGKIIHSTEYKSAEEFKHQKVVVVGSGTSAHDIAADLANNNTDITMFQRNPTFVMDLDKNWNLVALYSENGPPTEIADKLFASMPHLLLENGLAQRQTEAIMESDKKLLDDLRRAGFKLNKGIKDTGFLLLLKQKGGGHYFNVGASDLIISGKIKLKNDSLIHKFDADGLVFEDGSKIFADTVIFATGAGDMRDPIRSICGDDVANKCKTIWGLDDEGEFNGCWRYLGVKNLWYMTGSFQMVRIHSKHLALQIKAIQVSLYTGPYVGGFNAEL